MGDLSDYYDDEIDCCFNEDPTFAPVESKQKQYRVLTCVELRNEMDKIAAEVSSVVALPKAASRTLLRHFKWNKNTLIENFYENSDLTKYGIMQNGNSNDVILHKYSKSCCLICDSEGKTSSLNCSHTFCVVCWQMYLKTKINSDGASRILCPASNCTIVVPDEAITELLKRNDIKQRFLKLMTNDFVQNNRRLAFCPSAYCELVCQADSDGCQPVTCDCGELYCLACSQPWHGPISCELLRVWAKQCNTDGETLNWIVAYTKNCPKCQSPIEKNGGCNRMHCLRCNYQFCWTCMQSWNVHGYNTCNRYELSEEQDEKVTSSRESLQRYLHYYNRFRNHENSHKLEAKLYETMNAKTEMFNTAQGVSTVETKCLIESVDVLGRCRRTLMFTYVFAFYLKKTNVTVIFENNQQDLEVATEALSDILENQLSVETDFVAMRQLINDKTKYLKKRCEILIKHCMEGTEHDEWQYNIDLETIGTIPPY